MMQFLQKHKAPIGFALALIFVTFNTLISYRSLNLVITNNSLVTHNYEVINELQSLFSTVQDVETGQRGYIITGKPSYLEPHQRAVEKLPGHFRRLEMLTGGSDTHHYLAQIKEHVNKRVAVSQETIDERRNGNFERSQSIILSGRGKREMDAIRGLVTRVQAEESSSLGVQDKELDDSSFNSRLTLMLAALANLTLLGLVYHMIARALATRQRVEEAMTERTLLATLSADVALTLTRDDTLPLILQECAQSIVTHLDAAFARIWIFNEDNEVLEMQASAGMYTHLNGDHGRVPLGQLKIGRIAAERKPHLTNQVLGDPQVANQGWVKREGMVAFAGYPMIVGDRLIGVIAVFARQPLTEHALVALGTVADAVALGIQRKQGESKLLRSEARKSAILDTALDCIIGMDHEHHIVEWNPAAEKTFGYSREEAVGKILPELIIPESLRKAHYQGMQRYMQTGHGPVLDNRIEVPALRHDGEEFPIELAITRIVGEGEPFFTAYLRDITHRKQTEQDLERARDDAETANKTKSLFLANMSHELRTPLNAILGYSEMLQEEAGQSGMDEFASDLEKINTAGKHLLVLINDILDLSKIEAGKMELFIEEFDVEDIVQEITETLRPLLVKNKNELQIEFGPNLGEMKADLTKVRQSLSNLLSNAAKFTSEGQVRVETVRETMNDIEWIVLRVHDTGIGMSAEQLVKLFRPFTQADASTTRRFGGTGLGLALTRRFCQMMGGDVTVASTLGAGSTFTIKIPAAINAPSAMLLNEGTLVVVENPPDSLPPDIIEADNEESKPVATDERERILVIDDDTAQRELLHHFLTNEGFAVSTTNSGMEGLKMAQRIRPCAITLDVMMPDMDGWSVLSSLKNDPELCDIPVIMLTMVDDANQGYALGASDYLTKPIDRDRLSQLLQKYHCPRPPCSVLVVEDDETMRTMLSKMLINANWVVTQANNGREALDCIEEQVPTVILLDLMMPEMDGFDFIAELRQHPEWERIPVIVLTAKELTDDDRLRLNRYVQKVIQKTSYTREELLRQVRTMIDNSKIVDSKIVDSA